MPSSSSYISNNARIKIVATDNNENFSEVFSPYFTVEDSASPPPPWHTPERLTTAPDTGEYNSYSTLAVDGTGRVHLVYKFVDDDSISEGVITQKIYYQEKNGSTWSAPEEIYSFTQNTSSSLSGYQKFTDFHIALDSNNQPHIVWVSGGNEIFYTSFDGNSWNTPVNVSDNSTNSCEPDIAIDSDDNVHIVWRDEITGGGNNDSEVGIYALNHRIRHATGSWSTVSQVFDIKGNPPALTADENGKVHLVFTARNGLAYTYWNGAQWMPPMIIDQEGDEYFGKDIIVSPNENVHVAYDFFGDLGKGYVHQIRYSKFNGALWSAPEIV